MKKQEQIDALRFRIERIESHLAEQHKDNNFSKLNDSEKPNSCEPTQYLVSVNESVTAEPEIKMSDKKQTAVDWLFEQLPDHLRLSRDGFDMLQQAKQMEREQIEEAYGDGLNAHRTNFCNRNEYYDQTYGN
jgi:hypothetical protein